MIRKGHPYVTDKQTFYITTPIYYPSGRLHIGNAYSTLASDAIARYKRLMGYDVFFLTGTDEHGQKIENTAKGLGEAPQVYVDRMAAKIQDLWRQLKITNDGFIRTTDPAHKQAVQKIFQQLLDQGDIYLGEYEGWYSVSDEEYFTESQLVERFKDDQGQVIGGIAPTGNQVEKVKETCYFFRLSQYADRLVDYYDRHPEFIRPAFRKTEMVNNFIKPGLEDLAVSRSSFSWGIPVQSDPDHVVYVWIDALTNYITALGYGQEDKQRLDRYWPADVQVIGKDISRFHMIYWPAILMALDLPLPETIHAHGWIVMKDGKMSKSRGNVIYPETLIDRYGLDATRFYLLREMSLGGDTVFTPEDFVNRVNFELANDLGNLVNRTVSMINKYFYGEIPGEANIEMTDFDSDLVAWVEGELAHYHDQMELMAFNQALDHVMGIISRTNKYIDQTTPWILAKDDQLRPQLASVMYHLAESLRITAHLLRPFMPDAPQEIFRQLGLEAEWDRQLADLGWGQLPPACQVIAKGEPIFPRLDVEEEVAFLQAQMLGGLASSESEGEDWDPAETELVHDTDQEISFDHFVATELKVAEVVDVQPVVGSDKLLRFRLDAGDHGHRQVLSGIKEAYPDFESLVGKKVIIVANLKGRKIMGHISQGMILSAESAEGLKLIFADPAIANGSRLA